MNWLITGGCGFIGCALIRHLLADNTDKGANHRIRVYDNLSVGTREDLADTVGNAAELTETDGSTPWAGVQLVVGDLLDADGLAQAMTGADVAIHLAANTGVGPSVEDPMADARTNVFGTLNALEACRAAGTGRFVFASSGAPLGVQIPPLHEEMAPHPASPYGASKLAGEAYCSAYFHSFDVDAVALRFGNVYGPGSGHKQSVVAKFIKRAMAGEVLEIYGDGSQTRDFIYIGDLIQAVQKAATTPGIGGETFQIATAAETTVGELTEALADVLAEQTGTRPQVINVAPRTGDVDRNYSDTSKAADRLGWTSGVTLAQGLGRTVQSFVGPDAETKTGTKT